MAVLEKRDRDFEEQMRALEEERLAYQERIAARWAANNPGGSLQPQQQRTTSAPTGPKRTTGTGSSSSVILQPGAGLEPWAMTKDVEDQTSGHGEETGDAVTAAITGGVWHHKSFATAHPQHPIDHGHPPASSRAFSSSPAAGPGPQSPGDPSPPAALPAESPAPHFRQLAGGTSVGSRGRVPASAARGATTTSGGLGREGFGLSGGSPHDHHEDQRHPRAREEGAHQEDGDGMPRSRIGRGGGTSTSDIVSAVLPICSDLEQKLGVLIFQDRPAVEDAVSRNRIEVEEAHRRREKEREGEVDALRLELKAAEKVALRSQEQLVVAQEAVARQQRPSAEKDAQHQAAEGEMINGVGSAVPRLQQQRLQQRQSLKQQAMSLWDPQQAESTPLDPWLWDLSTAAGVAAGGGGKIMAPLGAGAGVGPRLPAAAAVADPDPGLRLGLVLPTPTTVLEAEELEFERKMSRVELQRQEWEGRLRGPVPRAGGPLEAVTRREFEVNVLGRVLGGSSMRR